MTNASSFTAFVDHRLLAAGPLGELLPKVKAWADKHIDSALLIFADADGRPVDFNLRGSIQDVLARVAPPKAGRGRPKLGVAGREVSLLPKQWVWLDAQPNGASAALRRLVDAEMKRDPGRADAARARDGASRFMSAIAGDMVGFEEATRALFAADAKRFASQIKPWPKDIRAHATRMSEAWFRYRARA